MINGIKISLPKIPTLSSVSSKSTYSISSYPVIGSSAVLPPVPPSALNHGLPKKYPENFINALQENFSGGLHLKTIDSSPDFSLLPKITELAQKTLRRQLPQEATEHIQGLAKLIKAYRIALFNKADLTRNGLGNDSPRIENMMKLAVETSGKANFEALTPEEKINFYTITGNIDALWALIKNQENSIMTEANKIGNSSEKESQIKQLKNDLSNLVYQLVSANNTEKQNDVIPANNIVPFAKQVSLLQV